MIKKKQLTNSIAERQKPINITPALIKKWEQIIKKGGKVRISAIHHHYSLDYMGNPGFGAKSGTYLYIETTKVS